MLRARDHENRPQPGVGVRQPSRSRHRQAPWNFARMLRAQPFTPASRSSSRSRGSPSRRAPGEPSMVATGYRSRSPCWRRSGWSHPACDRCEGRVAPLAPSLTNRPQLTGRLTWRCGLGAAGAGSRQSRCWGLPPLASHCTGRSASSARRKRAARGRRTAHGQSRTMGRPCVWRSVNEAPEVALKLIGQRHRG